MSDLAWRVIAAWLECFPEKPSWCRNEQVCQGWQTRRVNLRLNPKKIDTKGFLTDSGRMCHVK